MRARQDKFDHNHGRQHVWIDNAHAFVRTWQTDTGCTVVEAALEGISLDNKQDRKKLKAAALRLLTLADNANA